MKSYLFDIFILALTLGILVSISPERYKKIITAAFSLILATMLLSPINALIRDLGDIQPPDISDEDQGGAYIETAKSAFEEGVRVYLSSEFSIAEEFIEVEAVDFDFSAMRAEKILVTLKGRGALLDTKKIKSRLEEQNLGEVEVKIEL